MTFSIVARDPETGSLGVATATAGPVVGSLVPHGRAGVGAIATQSRTNPFFGFDGLDQLADPDSTAQAVLDRLLAADAGRDDRQCIIVDRRGGASVWTGPSCEPVAAGMARDNLAVAGNFLSAESVLEAMIAAFERTSGRLEDRLLTALAAGAAGGGDKRGTRSAALKVYGTHQYPAVDLRADWSETPVEDLSRILAAVRETAYAEFFETLPQR